MVEALKRLHSTPTREGLLDAIYEAPFDLGGVTLAYGPTNKKVDRSGLPNDPEGRWNVRTDFAAG